VFRVPGRCKHYLIKQLTSSKYVVVGETLAHATLQDLIQHYQKVSFFNKNMILNFCSLFKHRINSDGDILTLACANEVELTFSVRIFICKCTCRIQAPVRKESQ